MKQAFILLSDAQQIGGEAQLSGKLAADMEKLAAEAGAESARLYLQEIEGRTCLFLFLASGKAVETKELESVTGLEWRPAHHVYEFLLHDGDDYSNMQTAGIVIGVENGMLDEYIKLHDDQPYIIHELCYRNGFRKSSIFVVTVPGAERSYLLQFQDFSGEENPELYEDPTYIEWLRVTGLCQHPLPGEKFWKAMKEVWKYQG